ncbi:MAG TPA: O-antigen ligase family protein [Thermoanaerobaculia bacterium]
MPDTPAVTFGDGVAVVALVFVVLGSSLLVDPGAYASFDAPKRLVALGGACVAVFAAFGLGRRRVRLPETWRAMPSAARIALLALSFGLSWCGVSALLSPLRSMSLDGFRTIVLYSLLLPVGASRAVARGKGLLVAALLAGTAVNAAISIAQSRGVSLFRLQTFGTRNETGALVGNVGYLALALAFGGVLALGLALSVRSIAARAAAIGVLLLFLAGLVVNPNLTALVSLAAGGTVLVAARFGRRSILAIVAVVAALGAAATLAAPLRQRVAKAVGMARTGDWDRLTTYRTGAWAAALEMARERPLVGWGPGTYATEFVPHRLQAEIRARRRYVNPLLTSSYSEAHCDYLQAFAETGIPGGLAAIAAFGALVAALARRVRALPVLRPEGAILLGILAAGAAAALTWFPLQRPISAAPLLLAAGRGWRIAAGFREETVVP